MQLKIFFLLFVVLIMFVTHEKIYASSDQILITISPSMEQVIFDGKWTNTLEWKQSSHNQIEYDDQTVIHIRTAHFNEYMYVFVDYISNNQSNNSLDKSTICLDGKNNKNNIPDADDFCFSVSLGEKQGEIFQGNNKTSNMIKISNPSDFIAISDISDENDRYSTIPHPSFEFKIPIKLIERSDNYGFYLYVYDADSNIFYSWPQDLSNENMSRISSPYTWGNIISPDKSLPEFNTPIIIFIMMILFIILAQQSPKLKILRRFQT